MEGERAPLRERKLHLGGRGGRGEHWGDLFCFREVHVSMLCGVILHKWKENLPRHFGDNTTSHVLGQHKWRAS